MPVFPQHVNLVGGHLPNIGYLSLTEALDYLASCLTPLFGLPCADENEQRKFVFHTLEYLVKEGYCQAFLIQHCSYQYEKSKVQYEVTHEVPYKDDDGERYSIRIDVDRAEVYCGEYSGKLCVPTESFVYGVKMFIDNELHPDDQKSIRDKSKISPSSGLKPSTKKKRVLLLELIDDITARFKAQGEPFTMEKIPGTRKDFTILLRKIYKQEFSSIQNTTLYGYYKKGGLKFSPGSREGKTYIWQELFPEYYS